MPDLPRYVRHLPDGPWLFTDGPAVLEGREPASVAPQATGERQPLSPAAQAVLDAFRNVPDLRDCPSLAAAIRALADQVVPEDYDPPRGLSYPEKDACIDGECSRNEDIRSEILAIAAELKGADG